MTENRRGRPSKGESVAYTFRLSKQASDAFERLVESTGRTKTDVLEALLLDSFDKFETDAAEKLREIAAILDR